MKQIKLFFRRWESDFIYAGIIISKLHQVYVRFSGSTWSIHIIWTEWKNIYILHTRFTSSDQFTIKLWASSCGFLYWACVYRNTLCNCLSISFFSFFFSLQRFWIDWQRLISNVSPIAALSTSDQDRSYLYDMTCVFRLCYVEINSNGRLKREHLESSSSATENIFPLPHCLWTLNLAGWWLTMSGSH